MFITDEDYKVVIGDQALKVVSQVSAENRSNAELEAIEEIAGYLRPKYDTDAVFKASDSERNRLVVMYTCDIAIYERAVKWLEGVQAGKIIPDLPLALDENGETIGLPMKYGSQKKQRYNW